MAIPTSRTKDPGRISIDETLCNGCGLCVKVCKDFGLELKAGKAVISEHSAFGCIACGHCMAVCPIAAITIEGRCLSQEDLFPLDHKGGIYYADLLDLLQKRRSIREFKSIPVEKELIQKVLAAAISAPMGLPPSDVHVMILDEKEKVKKFSEDFCDLLKGMQWFVSSWFLAIMRPFWGKANDELFRGFVRPLFDIYITKMEKGENVLTYDAPVALYFYGSLYADPADPLIAATYAMLAAESLGLGTCFLGAIHPLIQYGSPAKKFREKYGIKFKSREGVFLIMGYPDVTYTKGIRRNFADVHWVK